MTYTILEIYTGYTESRLPKGDSQSYSLLGGEGHSDRFPVYFLLLLLLLFSNTQVSSAQRKSDIGLIGGTAYYLGDVNHTIHFNSLSPAGGFIFRYNFNPRNSIRFNAVYAGMKGDPADFNQPFPGYPEEKVDFLNLINIGLTTEFNFMPYKATKLRKDRYTPYVSGGIGYPILLGSKKDEIASPKPELNFAAGFKYNITTRMSGGIEWSFHKTFSDELDGVQNIGHENNVFFHNKDWYSIVGIFVTYKIFDWGIDCPAYE
jgi:hypothetical protein